MSRSSILVLFVFAVTVMAQQPPMARPWLGMALTVRESPAGAKFLYVGQVGPETPAEKAGIRGGDVITRFGRSKATFRDNLDVFEFVSRLTIGSRVPITLIRA